MKNQQYIQQIFSLLQSFIGQKITPSEFEKKFLADFKNHPDPLDEELFLILHEFFTDIDCYSPEITPTSEDNFNISEQTLRKRAVETVEALKTYLARHH